VHVEEVYVAYCDFCAWEEEGETEREAESLAEHPEKADPLDSREGWLAFMDEIVAAVRG
jgi:hypothetical protein